MTTATVAQPSGNGYAVLLCMFLLIGFVTVVVLWVHERRWDAHEEQLAAHAEQLATLGYQMPALLEFLGVEILEPVADDSPEAEISTLSTQTEASGGPDDCPTDEIPVSPATVPDGMPLAVQTALIERRPSPVPRNLADEMPHPVDSAERRAKTAADIEERLKQFTFTGRNR